MKKSELELLKKENEELKKELELAELRAENERLKRRILETKYPYNPYGITKLSPYGDIDDFTRNFGTYSDSNITLCSEAK